MLKFFRNKKLGKINIQTREHDAGIAILFGKFPLMRYSTNNNRTLWLLFNIPIWRQKKKLRERAIESFFYSPKQIPSAIGLQRIVQLSSFELLKYIRDVCRENEIEFWLDYGTLLGAVRHDGFIPWDDDVDIAMTRKNWEKMRALIPLVFSEQIFSYNINSLGFIQIGVKGTTMNVDIFPYDQTDSAWSPSEDKEIHFLNRVYRVGAKLSYEMDSLLHSSSRILGIDYVERRRLYNEEILEGKSSSSVGNWIQSYDVAFLGKMHRHTYVHNWLFPLVEKKFENEMFLIPNKSDFILHAKYGDWGEIPVRSKVHIDLNNIDDKMLDKMLFIIHNGLSAYVRELNSNK